MPQRDLYYEVRTMPVFGAPTPVASDIARHLQSRQYLGMTVVVCRNPLSMLSATRKQWLRLARNLQKQRASTLNAEEILRFTHTIMHMQHLQFVAQAPTAKTAAHIFFTTPDELTFLPPGCLSLYVTAAPRATQLHDWIDILAEHALVVDYEGTLDLPNLGLQPKSAIEAKMRHDWQELVSFMAANGVIVDDLVDGATIRHTSMDRALDALLVTGNGFLRRAAEFQHILSLSQPLKHEPLIHLKQFEAVMRLAHRVQALTPGAFSNFLADTFGDYHAESFFLRDAAPEEDELFALEPEQTYYYPMDGVPLRVEFV
ncbi:MAG TPA: hypothetical protein VM581_04390 [Magnetospirillaceae bacterium]|nr:hypothetical protein [Magnetospirillaceae bacterium]